jgi:gluconokinase
MSSSTPVQFPRTIIVMGVSGCGKSLIGSMIASHLGGIFEDADDFHSDANKAKMRSGTPLVDEDRWPWYATLRARIEEMRSLTPVYVLACSALKAVYRDRLRAADGPDDIAFIYLKGGRDVIFDRLSARKGHYMPASLLDSQIAILEETPDLLVVSIEQTPEMILKKVLECLGQRE